MTASGADTYAYDANGNQTGRTVSGVTTSYSYDALDRLTGIAGPVMAGYAYDSHRRARPQRETAEGRPIRCPSAVCID